MVPHDHTYREKPEQERVSFTRMGDSESRAGERIGVEFARAIGNAESIRDGDPGNAR